MSELGIAESHQLGQWMEQIVSYTQDHGGTVFEGVSTAIGTFTQLIENGLVAVPWWLWVALVVGLGFYRLGWKFATFCLIACGLILVMGFWQRTMITLALIVSSTLISLILGIPLGIWCAKSKPVNVVVRPALDLMQTMPAFVYLIPAAMFFGLGKVPGVLATVVFAMPPAVRLTSLGIKQVNKEQVEAGVAFGCTGWQLLLKVQIPGAMPSIMAGINQTIMMALSMIIIASMVGAGGLGNDVLTSISRLDIGLGFESGLCVVLLAIVLDRLTESFAGKRRDRLNPMG